VYANNPATAIVAGKIKRPGFDGMILGFSWEIIYETEA
jgi:hypothetical protein